MSITELFDRLIRESELTRAIQPYADQMDSSKYWLDLIRSEDPIGNTGYRSIMLRMKEENRLRCWFLQSDGGGFKTGDLQVTMAHQNPLSFKTIEVFKFSRKEERHWLPLKPTDQLKNLQLANKTFRSGTE